MSTSMKQAYGNFIEKSIANKTPLASFFCPHCSAALLTHAAPPDEYWDSMSTCPYCEGVFMKVTTGARVKTAVINDDATVTWR